MRKYVKQEVIQVYYRVVLWILIIKQFQQMLVSVLQNRRKKGKDNSVDKIKQYLKMTEKSSFSTSLIRPNGAISPQFGLKSSSNQNQNITPNLACHSLKNNKGSISTGNLMSVRSPFSNFQINGNIQVELTKKPSTRIIKEYYTPTGKAKTESEELSMKPKNGGYMLCHLNRKNKVKNEITIGIHNSIYTFREYLKASLAAIPKQPHPKITPETPGRKTIVFDMDETLIHTNQTLTKNYEIKVPFRSFQGRIGYGFVEVRPYAKEILKNLSKHFDVFIFTASTQAYADPIIDHLDPNGVVQHRLYRESCSLIRNQVFVKDLRVLGRTLESVLLVDNAPYSYMMQLQNGVPIVPFYRGKDDDQLVALEEYLMGFKEVEDVRKPNSEYFKLHQYKKFDSHEKLMNKLYGQWIK